MKRIELIRELCKKTNLTAHEVTLVFDGLSDIIIDNLKRGGKIHLTNIVTINAKQYDEKRVKNPKTGEFFMMPPRKVIKYKTSKSLMELINKK